MLLKLSYLRESLAAPSSEAPSALTEIMVVTSDATRIVSRLDWLRSLCSLYKWYMVSSTQSTLMKIQSTFST